MELVRKGKDLMTTWRGVRSGTFISSFLEGIGFQFAPCMICGVGKQGRGSRDNLRFFFTPNTCQNALDLGH